MQVTDLQHATRAYYKIKLDDGRTIRVVHKNASLWVAKGSKLGDPGEQMQFNGTTYYSAEQEPWGAAARRMIEAPVIEAPALEAPAPGTIIGEGPEIFLLLPLQVALKTLRALRMADPEGFQRAWDAITPEDHLVMLDASLEQG